MSEQIVIHRGFDLGTAHELSDTCWCGPTAIESDDFREGAEIAEELNRNDG